MLKWTVNKRAESALILNQSSGSKKNLHGRRSLGTLNRPLRNRDHRPDGRRRKSLGSSEISKRIQNCDKENQHISTPHPLNFRLNASSTPGNAAKYEFALRDVRNLTPSNVMTPNTTPSRKRPLPKTPPSTPRNTTPPKKTVCTTLYASTLPTFELEYSPCGPTIVPTTMKPLGTTITDTYFNQPRYINAADEESDAVSMPAPPASKRLKYSSPPPAVTPLTTRLSDMRFSKISFKRNSQRSKSTKSTKSKAENNNNNNNAENDESLSSSALNDTALERMIDAIIESAKKDKPSFVRSITSRKSNASHQAYNANFGSPTYTAAEDPASDLNLFCDKFLVSPDKVNAAAAERTIIIEDMEVVNEREVRTPEVNTKAVPIETVKCAERLNNDGSCHLRRQRAVRRKNTKTEAVPTELPAVITLTTSDTTEVKTEPQATNITESGSPETPPTEDNMFMTSFFKKSIDELACMNTPTPMVTETDNTDAKNPPQCAVTSITSKISFESTPGIHSTDLQASSTPTGAQAASIRRCLNFSDSPPESMIDSLEKRKSTASSIVSSSSSSRCFPSSIVASGSLDLAIFVENNKLNVHVIRCRDLSRQYGGKINAYVKVAIIAADSSVVGSYQRTAVHRNSIRPFFDHRFSFDNSDLSEVQRVQLAVWHRDREFKRSEFLGCMSFPIKDVLNKEFTGSFKLQPQTCLTTPLQPVVAMTDNSQSTVEETVANGNDDGIGSSSIGESVVASSATPAIDAEPQIPLSKKAIHQRDADENLFLRFLELDPPQPAVSAVSAVPASTGSIDWRRRSSQKKSSNASLPSATAPPAYSSQGRTPFTCTKKLTRTAEKGFGFSIVWTHPPRVEKVEPGLSAERSGIFPGDYVVFVGKQNVVTMPEVDILNLIKSHGNTLALEIFRRTEGTAARRPTISCIKPLNAESEMSNIEMLESAHKAAHRALNGTAMQVQIEPIAEADIELMSDDVIEIVSEAPAVVTAAAAPSTASINDLPPRPSTACSNVSFSMESAKRRMHLPTVTFSKEVGQGVIV